jgi:hypothetical protein
MCTQCDEAGPSEETEVQPSDGETKVDIEGQTFLWDDLFTTE